MSDQRWYAVDLEVWVKGRRQENVLAASEEEAKQKALARARNGYHFDGDGYSLDPVSVELVDIVGVRAAA